MRAKLIAIALPLGHAVLVCGCSDSHLGDGPPPTEQEYVAEHVAAEVEVLDRCCTRIGLAGAASHEADAIERGLAAVVPDGDAGARYDPAAAAECIESIRGQECELLKERGQLPAACRRVYARGHARLGESCRTWFDCAVSDGRETSCEATLRDGEVVSFCALMIYAGEGEACIDDDPDTALHCDAGLLCDENLGRCVRLAARGEPCMTGAAWGDTCQVGSVCDRTGTKICVEPTPVGEACDSSDNLCEALACTDGRCREPLFVTSGGACR